MVVLELNCLDGISFTALRQVPLTIVLQYCTHISMHVNNVEDVKGKIQLILSTNVIGTSII